MKIRITIRAIGWQAAVLYWCVAISLAFIVAGAFEATAMFLGLSRVPTTVIGVATMLVLCRGISVVWRDRDRGDV